MRYTMGEIDYSNIRMGERKERTKEEKGSGDVHKAIQVKLRIKKK